ncbi:MULTISPECIES: hypothetical protein [Mycobacteriaceae]|jgi:hypothetical protein|uniref:Uncharacterized protein n=3 Tax=Mycobacteriaceae TaxID=1762 RepID=A0A1Y0C6B5_9MYCO|nr:MULTISPECIES: hypothetical protein [Mycobacteriaceae]ART70596.1 hypothetical protein BTO20_20450 [Mycobacterium dioxanotrophicus]KLI09353.1 hypothetical protein AA982_04765 [Mycolicibacterium senegalense]KLO47745.1 hypothetical protein ABW05_31785 [Mycolicibacterium senegalense]OMB90691.1 hypothetical protein A5741_11745 [Mycolicibacterium conceptionense]
MTALSPKLQQAIDSAVHADEAWTQATFPSVEAVGIGVDDPDDPHVAVAVHGGCITYIGISDPMLHVDLEVLQDVLNAAIFTAFSSWTAQASGKAPRLMQD